jgi:cell wall-associated NlpC family hydrolase
LRNGHRKNFLILVFIVSTIYYGCSSTGTVRYGRNIEDNDEDQSSIRFTSEDDSMIVDLNLDLKDPDDLPADEPDIQISSIIDKQKQDYTYDIPGFDYTTLREKMLMEIIKYLDVPYKYGGTTRSGIDCSAFTQTIFKNVLTINLERSARMQYQQGIEVTDKDQLLFGDLVFFNTRKRVKPGHVGIYIGDNLFAHASSQKGVTISSLDHAYYSKRYIGARRFETDGISQSN